MGGRHSTVRACLSWYERKSDNKDSRARWGEKIGKIAWSWKIRNSIRQPSLGKFPWFDYSVFGGPTKAGSWWCIRQCKKLASRSTTKATARNNNSARNEAVFMPPVLCDELWSAIKTSWQSAVRISKENDRRKNAGLKMWRSPHVGRVRKLSPMRASAKCREERRKHRSLGMKHRWRWNQGSVTFA